MRGGVACCDNIFTMKITKYGHCCLLVEEKGLRILTDPGNYSTIPNTLENIDVVLITHEHADHFHLESLKILLAHNPKIQIITNRGVGALLHVEKIAHTLLEHGQAQDIDGVSFEGHGEKHALIYQGWKEVINTGYFIGSRLFYPGDAFYNPMKQVEILALPVAGPWMKISEAIDYTKAIKPKVCFPVHDGNIKSPMTLYRVITSTLDVQKIDFLPLVEGKEDNF